MDMFDYDDRNPYLRASSLAELCSFHDIEFVRCAFVTILGRQPDPSGETAYLRSLRAGTAKLSIIRDLRISAEGAGHDPGIAGLDRALRKHRNANVPVVGWFIRQFTGRMGNGPIERSLRILENDGAVSKQIATAGLMRLNAHVDKIDNKIDMLEIVLRSAIGRGLTTPSDIAEADAVEDGIWESAIHRLLDS